MASIRIRTIRIAIATALAAAAALAGVEVAHQAPSASHSNSVITVVRPAVIVDCC